MGLDVDFNNFDLGNPDPINFDHDAAHFGFNLNFDNDNINNAILVNSSSADFDLEDTLKGSWIITGTSRNTPRSLHKLSQPSITGCSGCLTSGLFTICKSTLVVI